MFARHLGAIVLALIAQHGFAASLPVYTSEPVDPENHFKINLVNFNHLNGDSAGLFYARGAFDATDPPTYAPLDLSGSASFWIPGPIDFDLDAIHALVKVRYLGWKLSSGGYIEDDETWRLLLPVALDAIADFNIAGANELTISMAAPLFAPGDNDYFQHMFVGLSMSANNGASTALLFDWVLQAVPEPTSASMLAIAGVLATALRRR